MTQGPSNLKDSVVAALRAIPWLIALVFIALSRPALANSAGVVVAMGLLSAAISRLAPVQVARLRQIRRNYPKDDSE
ncbi:hypothetical protein [Asticcacaulis benevestitus]|uniref:Uncharacterized protein n=1 Tax=Asticcacaulis benevestitus DSM 16100 = ATCC BAA-896 TaxID=1121022 RepID=V4PNS5_9CAUL|nr:hypothetical protein [Asticcacaulis benevestitus]ESQ89936.1 hypothetical protein ABENE_13100 [Asticcacaulis benevestitus DSM 16100 = ATCC BAA-896]